MTRLGSALLAALLLGSAGAAPAPAPAAGDPVLSALRKELGRSWRRLRKAEKEPLHFLAYQVNDSRVYEATAVMGALRSESERHYRFLDVDARVGSARLDSTHQIKGREGWFDSPEEVQTEITVDSDESALRAEVWLRTDKAYKEALKRYTRVLTNKAVTAEEEDKSDDFSIEPPRRHYDRVEYPSFDKAALRERLRRLSAAFRGRPHVYESHVSLSIDSDNRYLVNSEGSEVVTGNLYVRLSYRASTRTEDGMDLERSRSYDAARLEDLPSDEAVLGDIRRSLEELAALRAAPVVEPYTGPAIIRNRATAVFFHEILGHRLEGHRQKIEDEGQTFTKMLGKPILVPSLSVHDDPTISSWDGAFLRGHYRFDDEGVPARRITLVDKGALKAFLMSRSPVNGFPASNGHGRRSPGHGVVARMGNLVVEAHETVPYQELRARLIAEVRRQGKPYGLILDDIAGGFTGTTRSGPQSFKVIPLLVWRVYPDGRPDQAVRGVDIVGTPLTSFGKIAAAADDYGVFNGTCGAESGWVPVSAVAPSVLVSELEVEKKQKSSEKPPILPSPLAGRP